MEEEMNIGSGNKNPRENANFMSILFFWHTIPTFRKGRQKEFSEKDLYMVLNEDKSEILTSVLENEWVTQLQQKNPSLRIALFNLYRRKLLKYCVTLLLLASVRLCQPISLYYLLLYYMPNQTEYTLQHAYICMSSIIVSLFTFVIFSHVYFFSLQHIGMKMKIACSNLIYRKALKLSLKTLETISIGQIINLLSNDASRFDNLVLYVPHILVIPLEFSVITALLCFFVGYSAFSGICFIITLLPIELLLGRKFSKLRRKTALKTDERIHIMNEIISGIGVIKMYSWEVSFIKLVSHVRKLEIREILKTSYIKSIVISLSIFMSRASIFLTIMVYVLVGNVPTAEHVFLLVGLFNILRHSMTVVLPALISLIAEGIISIGRVQSFLMLEEKESSSVKNVTLKDTIGVSFENVYAKWTSSAPEYTLNNICFKIDEGQLIAIIGPVGTGKSSLLQMILEELPVLSGELKINGKITYVPQEAWLFRGNIRQNILFGEEFDNIKYNEVIDVCALRSDFSIFPCGDNTVIGDKGEQLSGGQKARINLARAVYTDADIFLLDDPLSAVDTQVGKHIFNNCICGYLRSKCIILVTHQIHYLKLIPRIILFQNGKILYDGSYDNLTTAAPQFTRLLEKGDIAQDGDTKPVDVEIDIYSPMISRFQQEERQHGSVNQSVYMSYIRSAGNLAKMFGVILLFILTQICISSTDFFVNIWVVTEEKRELDTTSKLLSRNTCAYIYIGAISTVVIITIIRSVTFFKYCMAASIGLYEKMFNRVVRAPMSFFEAHPSGRILNKFSKDMGTIDEQLPLVALDTTQIALQVLGIIIVTSVITPYVLVALFVFACLFLYLRSIYIKASRNIKRLEGITKSPIFTLINASLDGIMTIRAFKAESMLRQQYERYYDIHTSCWYLFLSVSRAFGFCLDCICCIYISCVGFSFFIFHDVAIGGNVGLAMTQSLLLTGMFQWGMRQWVEMENMMTSVERVHEYTKLDQEGTDSISIPPPKYWPRRGEIEFSRVYLRYEKDQPYMLNNLSFKINSKDKIGIVGRTGAGKSSIIKALFRLSEVEGTITIDSIDIKKIPLNILRSRIAIIPQEPFLFSGTLRKNLDPFNEHTDDVLWSAIEDVKLLSAVFDLPDGLNTRVTIGGVNFSVGQRQLLCLARAIIRQNNILVMDEATANVDLETDSMIQQTIRDHFHQCTVLTIAHRLYTVLDSDKVLVMEYGTLMEYEHPYILLQNTESIFYNLIKLSGRYTMSAFTEAAKKNYEEKFINPDPDTQEEAF